MRPWTEVIDRIGVTARGEPRCRDATGELGQGAAAGRRRLLGRIRILRHGDRGPKIPGLCAGRRIWSGSFTRLASAAREVAADATACSAMAERCHKLLLDLSSVATELNAKGVTDRSEIDALAGGAVSASERAAASIELSATTGSAGDPRILLRGAQNRASARRADKPAATDPDEAAAELTTVYMTDFEPLERYFLGDRPQAVRPLEIQFNGCAAICRGAQGRRAGVAARAALDRSRP